MVDLSAYIFECVCKRRSVPSGIYNSQLEKRMKDEIEEVKRKNTEDTSTIENMQKELDNLKVDMPTSPIINVFITEIAERIKIKDGRKPSLKVATVTSLKNEGIELNCPSCGRNLFHWHTSVKDKEDCKCEK